MLLGGMMSPTQRESDMQITLATLPDATAQQVFDQVATHLLTQGAQSRTTSPTSNPQAIDATSCLYRGPNGLMCAAGSLMADHEYRSEFETNNWTDLVYGMGVDGTHEDLIEALQSVHDTNLPDSWPERLEEIAEGYGVDAAVVAAYLLARQ